MVKALAPAAVEGILAQRAGGASEEERHAADRLCGGDAARAIFLLTDAGRELRARAERSARAARAAKLADSPWLGLLEAAGEAGGVEVSLEVLDDATDSGWDAAATGANARTATEDTTAIDSTR